MKLIDEKLLDETTQKAKQSPRLRMNYNFHETLDDPGQNGSFHPVTRQGGSVSLRRLRDCDRYLYPRPAKGPLRWGNTGWSLARISRISIRNSDL